MSTALTRFTPGMAPAAIVAHALAAPVLPRISVELDPTMPATMEGGGLLPMGKTELTLPDDIDGTLVRPVGPEQMLAVLASLIATAPNAMAACVRVKQEVAGWRFQQVEGGEIR